jgi:hypothetical protein
MELMADPTISGGSQPETLTMQNHTAAASRNRIRDLLLRLAFVKDATRQAALFEELSRSVRDARTARVAQRRRRWTNRNQYTGS